jgi:hypothetical protein
LSWVVNPAQPCLLRRLLQSHAWPPAPAHVGVAGQPGVAGWRKWRWWQWWRWWR